MLYLRRGRESISRWTGKCLRVVSSFEEADRQDKVYWLSRTPVERLQYMNFCGESIMALTLSSDFKRVLEVAERA